MSAGGPGTFGERLRRHRIAAGLMQEALAERSGLSVRGIADLERGVRRLPRVDTIRRLAEALVLAPDDRAALVAAGQWSVEIPEPPSSAPQPRLCGHCRRLNDPDARSVWPAVALWEWSAHPARSRPSRRRASVGPVARPSCLPW